MSSECAVESDVELSESLASVPLSPLVPLPSINVGLAPAAPATAAAATAAAASAEEEVLDRRCSGGPDCERSIEL